MSIGIFKYDINGGHVVLDENNKPMQFETEDKAVEFLKINGLSEEDIQDLVIREFEEDELTDTYESEVTRE